MLRKVLIANRGEIAVRIARAARSLGIASVVAHSEVDGDGLAVRVADEAVCIGPAEARLSYLDGDRILSAARERGADAIHPGYGFLSQDPSFVDACERAGVVFVGPPAAAMRAMGEKIPARRAMAAAGVPVVPGSLDPVSDEDAATREATALGWPVMLKASSGGGGKGIRLVSGPAEMRAAFSTATAEARAAFGREEVYLEKAILAPRHIEVQVMADSHGNCLAVGERECSIQRRHQKIVEECPANRLSAAARAGLHEAAVRAARAVGYRNAGTVEFLVDGEERFHFLEMNTRIQVEHPVTEEVFGVDLVREQLLVAGGAPLSFGAADLRPRGHAIEVRLCAEDPEDGFSPSTGRVRRLHLPGGPGVRFDGGVHAGLDVTVHYDPLLGKLIAHGRHRDEALTRLRAALDEVVVAGVRTTAPFLRRLADHRDFVAGRYDTGFLQGPGRPLLDRPPAGPDDVLAAVAAVLRRRRGPGPAERPAEDASPWTLVGRAARNRGWRP